jgi:thioredoxin
MAEHLDKESFKRKVFDWDANRDWKYEGSLPAIVDFYAEWCGPCKMIGPVLEELSRKHEGEMSVYKVDIDKEAELASIFGITSVPTLLFIPKEGMPRMALGALPKPQIEKIMGEVLGISKEAVKAS